jgi:lysophospholipase L1-like esterase
MKFTILLFMLTTLFAAAPGVMAANPLSFADLDARGQAGEPLSIVFFGGSLTWGANASDPNLTSWRGRMKDYLRHQYPKSPITFHDAAIGGTGTALGLFRLDRDVLAYKPDLVFLEFTVNDNLFGSDETALLPYETIVRELLSKNVPIMQVLTTDKSQALAAPDAPPPPRYVQHRKLSSAYGLPVGDVLMRLRKLHADGKLDPKIYWPFDGIHPDDIGYEQFFEAVREGYEQGIAQKAVCHLTDEPVFGVYTTHERIILVNRPLPAGWERAKTYRTSMWFDGLSSRWMGDVAVCDIKNKETVEPLKVDFTGTFVALFGEADQDSVGFKASVDGKPLLYRHKHSDPGTDIWPSDTSRWKEGRLFIFRLLANDLTPGKHTLEITPVFPPDKIKGQLRIESICVAGGASQEAKH